LHVATWEAFYGKRREDRESHDEAVRFYFFAGFPCLTLPL